MIMSLKDMGTIHYQWLARAHEQMRIAACTQCMILIESPSQRVTLLLMTVPSAVHDSWQMMYQVKADMHGVKPGSGFPRTAAVLGAGVSMHQKLTHLCRLQKTQALTRTVTDSR